MPSDQEESSPCCHMGPQAIHAPFVVLYTLLYYYITIIRIISKSETAFWCVFIAENLPISTSTKGDQ
jgi:hypothetical protein